MKKPKENTLIISRISFDKALKAREAIKDTLNVFKELYGVNDLIGEDIYEALEKEDLKLYLEMKKYQENLLRDNKEKDGGWLDLSTVPKNATWFEGLTTDNKIVRCHYACDLSGEEQPAFEGFFKRVGDSMIGIDIRKWRKEKTEK